MSSVSELLEQTLRRARRERLWQPGPETQSLAIKGDDLYRLLRHRPPFLMVDTISAVDLPRRAIAGYRKIDPNDPVFAGHFPGNPIYPGVLLIETMGQLAHCFRGIDIQGSDDPCFVTVCKSVFLRPVLPGDELEILGVCIGAHDGIYSRGVGQILRQGQICAAAIVEGSYVGE